MKLRQPERHDASVRLRRVVPRDGANFGVLPQLGRVIKDARGHADQVSVLVSSLGAVAVDGLAPADELTGLLVVHGEIDAARVEVSDSVWHLDQSIISGVDSRVQVGHCRDLIDAVLRQGSLLAL